MVTAHWMTLFRDLPAAAPGLDPADAAAYWAQVSGTTLSPWRGDHEEFATLVPRTGDPVLRVQRVLDGPGGAHLDLHVRDPREAAVEAVGLGATQVADHGHVVLRSPGGLLFCFVTAQFSHVPSGWQSDHDPEHRTDIDQICLDVPAGDWDREVDFWSQLTGWPVRRTPAHPEFAWLEPTGPESTGPGTTGLPVRLLVQRLADDTAARAHLDGRTTDLRAERLRQEALGAVVVAEHEDWLVFRDPWGGCYCLAQRGTQPIDQQDRA